MLPFKYTGAHPDLTALAEGLTDAMVNPKIRRAPVVKDDDGSSPAAVAVARNWRVMFGWGALIVLFTAASAGSLLLCAAAAQSRRVRGL